MKLRYIILAVLAVAFLLILAVGTVHAEDTKTSDTSSVADSVTPPIEETPKAEVAPPEGDTSLLNSVNELLAIVKFFSFFVFPAFLLIICFVWFARTFIRF